MHPDNQCCSSHDLIAHLMNIACTLATDNQNTARAEMQTQLQAALFAEVDSWAAGATGTDNLPRVDWSYQTMAAFTRKYIQSYMPDPAKQQDIRFLPVTEIDRTHPVHRKALEFQKAQDVLYGKCSSALVKSRPYESMSYAELVQVSVLRILESA